MQKKYEGVPIIVSRTVEMEHIDYTVHDEGVSQLLGWRQVAFTVQHSRGQMFWATKSSKVTKQGLKQQQMD